MLPKAIMRREWDFFTCTETVGRVLLSEVLCVLLSDHSAQKGYTMHTKCGQSAPLHDFPSFLNLQMPDDMFHSNWLLFSCASAITQL